MAQIHPLAVVSSQAELGRDVVIGPFCVVESGVILGDGCTLASHVVVKEGTQLGANNHVSEGAVIGGGPQHTAPPKNIGGIITGENNVIREHVTIHRSLKEGHNTILGSNNYLMSGVHIAHDCVLHSNIILATYATLGGHVLVGGRALVSGLVAVHQFCRIGKFAMIGGSARVVQDIAPYVTIDGTSGTVVGLNRVGLKRNGFTDQDFLQLKAAYRIIFRSGNCWADVLSKLQHDFPAGPASHFHDFLVGSVRGLVRERHPPRGATVPLEPAATSLEESATEPKLRIRAG